MAETISSAANPLVKRVRLLTAPSRKHRREQGAFVVEGRQPVWRAITAGWPVEALIVDADLRDDSAAAAMVEEQERSGVRVARITHDLFLRLASREGSPGLAAIVTARRTSLDDLTASPDSVFVALHKIANPGNLGTIIRTLDATGGDGVILIGDSTDPYAPTAVKASMGSVFAVPVAHVPTPDAFFGWAAARGVTVLATSGKATMDHWHATYQPPLAVLFGSEGEGLPASLLHRADQRIAIPMTGTAESLNLAAAAAVMLYEINRPR
ncbi:MAG TPA: RNA methyltransferase [Streptosporangiaceae bacterium]|jgi:TrmH family RNA methyltransferase|nr:RNA methyltransferase [Streptosporangiaceae bacterium]